MDNNPQGMPPTQPPQYNGGMPPNPPLPPQSEVIVKPSWQVQAMQKVWSQQGGGSSQSEPLPPIPPNGPMPFPPTSQAYDPYQSAGPVGSPPPTNNNQYTTASKGSSSKWMVAIIVLTLLVLGGAGALFYLLRPAPPDSNRILSDTLNKALKTSTYQEKLTIKSPEGTVTRTREADLRKLDEPRLHVDNIAATETEGQIEAVVIGRDYYVKRQVNAQDLSAADSEATKTILNAASDQWVLAINDGAIVNTAAVKALNVATTLQKLRVVVPSPVIIGYFSNENQQALNDLISQGGVYAASTVPVEETLGNETVWRQKVKVNQEGVKMINNQAARLLGNEEGSLNEVLETLTPSDMELWIRKSDSRLTQIRYTLGEATYTLAYEKIDQNVTIDAPELAPQAALTATDKDLQATADKVAAVLRTYQTQGNVLPGTAASFKELVDQRVSEDIRNNYAISFQSGTPKKGYIFYQAGYVCTSKSGGFKKVSSPQSFAVVTGLASSLYCTGQGE